MSLKNVLEEPIKRDLIVEEFLKTKKNIQEKFVTERLGDISAQRELSKLFKPITETQGYKRKLSK